MRLELFYAWNDVVPVESYPTGQEPDHFKARPRASERGRYLVDYRLRHDVHNWLIERGELDYSWGFSSMETNRNGIYLWLEFEQNDTPLLFKLTWGGQ